MRRMLVAIVALLAVAVAGTARAADPPGVAGTRIGLVPPAGFEPAPNALGFVNRRAGASILVNELPPAAYPALRATVPQPDSWKKRGLDFVQEHRLDGFPYEHVLAQARGMQDGKPVDVWMLVLGEREVTGTVVVNVSQAPSPALTPAQVKKMLAGVRVVAPPADPMARLVFTVDPPARFTHRQTVGDRQMLLKESPLPPVGATDDITAMVIAVTQVPPRPEQREMFARQHLFSQKAMRIELLDAAKPTTLNGMPALEMTGQGRDAAGEQRHVFVVMAFGAKSSYIVQAMAPERRLAAAMPDLQKLARSLKPK